MIELLELIGKVAAATLAVCALLALFGRWVARRLFLPWLHETLIEPLEATRHQVTANNHKSPDAPTVPDLLHTLSDQVTAMDTTFAGHLGDAAATWATFDRRIKALERLTKRRPRP